MSATTTKPETRTSTRTTNAVNDVLETLDGSKIKTKDMFLRFVQKRRDAVNKTKAQVAKAIDYNSGEYFGLIESGTRVVAIEKVPLWADALELDRKAFTRLFLKLYVPNVYFTFWGEEELALQAPETQKKFVRITEPEIDLLNKLNRMPASARKSVVSMVELLAAKAD